MQTTYSYGYNANVTYSPLRLGCRAAIRIETWGASGGTSGYGGLGGYASAEVIIDKNDVLYIFVGSVLGHNGGGSGHGLSSDSGGGAADVRLNSTNLSNRIVVAGGGGGFGGAVGTSGGYGGGLVGGAGVTRRGTGGGGGTQTSGGVGGQGYKAGSGYGTSGWFGYGGSNNFGVKSGGGGGGGGWYGGGGGGSDYPTWDDRDDSGGGGGSSYVTPSATNSIIISGDNYMPAPNGGTQIGQDGNGYVRITVLMVDLSLLQKDGLYYIPTSQHFNVATKSFNPVTLENVIKEGPEIINSSINTPFEINGITYAPLDYIDISKCKIAHMSIDNSYTYSNINYSLSDVALSKTTVKVKSIWEVQGLKNGYLNVSSTDKSSVNYKLAYSYSTDYGNCNVIDMQTLKDNFYASFTFAKTSGVISSCSLYSIDKISYSKIKDDYLSIEKNIANMYVTFNNAYNKVYLNKIDKVDYKYINTSLETF